MQLGATAATSAGVSENRVIRSIVRLVTNTSAVAASRCTQATPSAVVRSTAMPRLPRLSSSQ